MFLFNVYLQKKLSQLTIRKSCLLLLFLCPYFVQAQKNETIVKEVILNTNSKPQALQKVVNQLSRTLVVDMIGDKKFHQKKALIEKHIIKHKNRYILSSKTSQATLQNDGRFAITVSVQISRKNLKHLLVENQIMHTSKGTFCILPVVSFSSFFDGKKNSFSWWLQQEESASTLLAEISSNFFDSLSREFIKTGFYVINPVFQKLFEATPSKILPGSSSRVKHFIPLAKFYSCDIILSGIIEIGEISASSQYSTSFSFNIFNIKTRQFLFKLKKKFPYFIAVQKNSKKEMETRLQDVLASVVYQVSTYKEEGSLDLNRLKLSIQGPLNYGQKEELKNLLINKIKGIESLQEKHISSNRIVYEAEASGNIKSILKQLKTISLPNFFIQVTGSRRNQLEIYVKTHKK